MKPTSRRRVAFWGGVAIVIVGAGVVAMMPRALPVDVAIVARGPLVVTLDHEGQTRVRDRFVVSAPVPGRVQRIELRPGDRVVANRTALATFLPATSPLLDARTRAEAQARLKAAEAALERASAERDQARVQSDFANGERDRARGMFTSGLVTAQARQAAESEALARQRALEAAESAVRAAAHDVDTARAALLEPGGQTARTSGAPPTLTLRSPIDGVVLRRIHESEAVVPQGEPLLEVADVSDLEVYADYLSTDAVRIRPGMPVLIEQWGGTGPLKGTVRRVEPSGFLKVSALGVEEQRVWVIVGLDDPRAAWEALGDGYRVEARVITWERPDVVTTPTSSLFRRSQGWAVFVVEGGRARLRAVTVGQRNGAAAEVVAGLKPGERVIVYPPDSVADGVRVTERGK
jgi:HlyD family secretion protein